MFLNANRREPRRHSWIENRSVHRHVPQRDRRLLEQNSGSCQRVRADRMLPGHVFQPDIVRVRFQRAQLRAGHGLFRKSVRVGASSARDTERTVRIGRSRWRQPAAETHELVAVSQVEHVVVTGNVQSVRRHR